MFTTLLPSDNLRGLTPFNPQYRTVLESALSMIYELWLEREVNSNRAGMQVPVPPGSGGGGRPTICLGRIIAVHGNSSTGWTYDVHSDTGQFEDLINAAPTFRQFAAENVYALHAGVIVGISYVDETGAPVEPFPFLMCAAEEYILTLCDGSSPGTGNEDPDPPGGDPGLRSASADDAAIGSISQTTPGPFNGGQTEWENNGGTIKDLLDWLHASVTTLNAAPAAPTIVSAYKTGDESISNTTLQDDNHITVSLAASSIYNFKIFAFISTAGALEGFKAGLNGTAGITSLKAEITIFDDVSNTMVALDRLTAFGSSAGAGLSLGSSFCTIEGTIETSTAGTMLLSWAQNGGAGVAATTVQRNSWMQATKLA